MSKRLNDLRRLLTEPESAHLDDLRLAELAAATAAGEDMETAYAAELAHIEQCAVCADAYDELVALSETAVADMHLAAQEMTPQALFVELISREIGESVEKDEIDQVIASLPLFFAQQPASAAAFDRTLADKFRPTQSHHLPRILQAVRRNLAALTAYLASAANAIWQNPLQTETTQADQGYILNFQPALAPAIPILGGDVAGKKRELFSRRVGQMTPLQVDVQAQRQTELACVLAIRVDRPGLATAAGRQITVIYGARSDTKITDDNGVAMFNEVPVAALASLVLNIDEQPQGSPP